MRDGISLRIVRWPIVSTEELFMAVMAAKMPLNVHMLATRVARAASFEAAARGHGTGKCGPVALLMSSADRRWQELSAVLFDHDRGIFASANALDPVLYVNIARLERDKSLLLDA
jgi:hypothetical protein